MSKIEARVKELQSNSKAYSNTVKERMLSGVSVSPETTKKNSLPYLYPCSASSALGSTQHGRLLQELSAQSQSDL